MSNKANPTVIGGFVLGAVALIVVALAVFGSGKLLGRHPKAVAFFQGNIQGLSVGAPVNLRGVQIGTVTDIQIRLDVKTMEPVIPVYMEFDPDHLRVEGNVTATETATQEPLKRAIANGLHARLATQSLVTGQLAVELDLNPGEPRRIVGADASTVEIPTSQSDIEKLKNVLGKLPLSEIAESALKLLQDADRLVTSDELTGVLRSMAAAGDNVAGLAGDTRKDLPPLLGNARDTLEKLDTAIGDLQTTLKTASGILDGSGRQALGSAVAALQQAQKLLTDADSLLAVNSPQRADLDQTLRNLTAASRSLRAFSEDLERRPNSIIVGR